jgi:hypothetical protein
LEPLVERRRAGRDAEAADLGEDVEELLREAVRKVAVLGVPAPVDERENRDRRTGGGGGATRDATGAGA